MRAFLDTNFLLDCVLPGRPEHASAQAIKGLVDVGLIEGVVSACSLKDAYYILTKQAGESRAREVVRDCLKSYSLEPLDQEACFTSAYSDEPDFEDGCIRAMAERAGADLSSRAIEPLLCARPSRPSRPQSSSGRFRFRRSKSAISGIVLDMAVLLGSSLMMSSMRRFRVAPLRHQLVKGSAAVEYGKCNHANDRRQNRAARRGDAHGKQRIGIGVR